MRSSKPSKASRWTVYDVDRLGRTVRVIENYQDGVDDARDDQDIITTQVYDNGLGAGSGFMISAKFPVTV
jgi:hypothetical protein